MRIGVFLEKSGASTRAWRSACSRSAPRCDRQAPGTHAVVEQSFLGRVASPWLGRALFRRQVVDGRWRPQSSYRPYSRITPRPSNTTCSSPIVQEPADRG